MDGIASARLAEMLKIEKRDNLWLILKVLIIVKLVIEQWMKVSFIYPKD
jgi:hypothetical protein